MQQIINQAASEGHGPHYRGLEFSSVSRKKKTKIALYHSCLEAWYHWLEHSVRLKGIQMPTPLKAITVVKNLPIATINLTTLCCMGLVIALYLLRFSPLLWELTAAKLLRAVTPTCHSRG